MRRMFFTNLFAAAFDCPDFCLTGADVRQHEGRLIVINLTKIAIETVFETHPRGPFCSIINSIGAEATNVTQELLAKLRAIASKGFVRSVMEQRADTAIGRTLETALGIEINSRREPDYKGIELKSYRRALRKSRENRKTLFAKVANWSISKFKSSREILDEFGYSRDDDFKLYCTISTQILRVYFSNWMTMAST